MLKKWIKQGAEWKRPWAFIAPVEPDLPGKMQDASVSEVIDHLIQEQIDDLTKKTSEEITRLKNEKLKAEIDHKNKELATSAMLLINKNQFINDIKHHLNAILKKDSLEERSKELTSIIKDIDKNDTRHSVE